MMDRYVTGAVIRRLREEKKMTQEELASRLFISGKTVSKWETGRGLPDIALLTPLAEALGVSVTELCAAEPVYNRNRAANMMKTHFYVCPFCGNVIHAIGEAAVSCCGVILPPLTAEVGDIDHDIVVTAADDEYVVAMDHPMTKDHYISFFAAVADNGVELQKLYPEGPAEARFKRRRVKYLFAFCDRHGLFVKKC